MGEARGIERWKRAWTHLLLPRGAAYKDLSKAANKFFEDCRTACLAIKALLEARIEREDWKLVRSAVEEVLGELLGWQDEYRTMFLSKLAQPYEKGLKNHKLPEKSITKLTEECEKLASNLQRIFVAAAFEALAAAVSQHETIPPKQAAVQVEERIGNRKIKNHFRYSFNSF